MPKSTVKDVAECKPGVIEIVLANLRMKVSYSFFSLLASLDNVDPHSLLIDCTEPFSCLLQRRYIAASKLPTVILQF